MYNEMGNQLSSSGDISDDSRIIAEEMFHQIDEDGTGRIDMDKQWSCGPELSFYQC